MNGAVAVVPFEEALHGILLPLQKQVGQLWHDDHLDVAIEHYVTKQIQQKIFSAMNQLPVAEFGPKLVVACPPGEEHDVAALAVAYRCRVRGCRVYYLGANVPIASLTHLCSTVDPDLTILSIPLALSGDKANALIRALADEGQSFAKVSVGGDGARANRDIFAGAQVEVLEDFSALDDKLNRLMRQRTS